MWTLQRDIRVDLFLGIYGDRVPRSFVSIEKCRRELNRAKKTEREGGRFSRERANSVPRRIIEGGKNEEDGTNEGYSVRKPVTGRKNKGEKNVRGRGEKQRTEKGPQGAANLA